jgi:hypothetical protein
MMGDAAAFTLIESSKNPLINVPKNPCSSVFIRGLKNFVAGYKFTTNDTFFPFSASAGCRSLLRHNNRA